MSSSSFNTFFGQGRCSQPGDICRNDGDCLDSCESLAKNITMSCIGTPYEKARNMGVCYPTVALVGDPCVVGEYPDCNNALPPIPGVPPMYCQETIYVDSRPNSAPSFAAPYVGEGYCMPVHGHGRSRGTGHGQNPYPPSKTFSWLQ